MTDQAFKFVNRSSGAELGIRYRPPEIDFPAVVDCAGAINNLSGLIEFKR